MRGDRPFAYDLVIEYGAVSGRVVLLLRSAEAKPRFFTSVFITKTPHPRLCFGGPGEGKKCPERFYEPLYRHPSHRYDPSGEGGRLRTVIH
jgi:hypothetical protein